MRGDGWPVPAVCAICAPSCRQGFGAPEVFTRRRQRQIDVYQRRAVVAAEAVPGAKSLFPVEIAEIVAPDKPPQHGPQASKPLHASRVCRRLRTATRASGRVWKACGPVARPPSRRSSRSMPGPGCMMTARSIITRVWGHIRSVRICIMQRLRLLPSHGEHDHEDSIFACTTSSVIKSEPMVTAPSKSAFTSSYSASVSQSGGTK